MFYRFSVGKRCGHGSRNHEALPECELLFSARQPKEDVMVPVIVYGILGLLSAGLMGHISGRPSRAGRIWSGIGYALLLVPWAAGMGVAFAGMNGQNSPSVEDLVYSTPIIDVGIENNVVVSTMHGETVSVGQAPYYHYSVPGKDGGVRTYEASTYDVPLFYDNPKGESDLRCFESHMKFPSSWFAIDSRWGYRCEIHVPRGTVLHPGAL